MFKLTAEQLNIVDKVIESMEIPMNFGPYGSDYDADGLDDIYQGWRLEDELEEDPVKDFNCGVTKAVFILNKVPAVLKVPFNGCEKQAIDYEDFDWERDYDFEWIEYSGADPLERTDEWNYCKTELEIYEIAKDEGLSAFFPYTQYLTDVDNHPVYLQEKVEILNNMPDYFEKGRESSNSEIVRSVQLEVSTGELNPYWIFKAVTYHGVELFRKLIDFLERMNCMEDLHSGNVGFIDDRPVLIDWIGWRE